jgi:hypothetical protein
MMHEDEMIFRMHERAARKQAGKERRIIAAEGGAGAALIALLLGIIIRLDKGGHSISRMSFAGASLLGNDVGGYVLIALIAFLAGVTVTVVSFRYRKLKETPNSPSGEHES